jgi:K+-transporting ATPase ATPase C chain
MKEVLRPAIVSLLAFTVILGLLYPWAMDGIASVFFPRQASGSLIKDKDGHVAGSEHIGQPFDNPAYFWSRPTARANYDASSSAGTNMGQSSFVGDHGTIGPNATLTKTTQDRIAALRAADPGNTAPVPVDLVTSSASGLDPDISPAAAYYQVGRVARLRGQPEAAVRQVVDATIEGRQLGILGEPRVNVLRLNRAMDATFGPAKPNG